MAARNRFGISAIALLVIGLFAVCVCAEHRPDEILIKYKVGRKAQAQLSALSVNAQAAQSIDRIRFQRFKLPKGLSVEQAIARFKNDPNVEYVGPVNIIRPCLEPNDELYASGMTITFEDIFGDFITETYTQWWLDSANGISAPQAWDVNTGATSNIIIAIVDSGVRADHEDLAGKMIPGYNAIYGEETTTQYDDVGHGTEVAGVAAAMTNNTTGMAGVCWGARIMPVKIIKVTGYDEFWGTPIVSGDDADGAAGIIWAADHGAKIINMSFGGYLADLESPDVVIKDAVDYAWAKGCVLVGGSGNDDKDGVGSPFYPACYDSVLSVGATNESSQRCTEADWDPDGWGQLLGQTPASNFGPWLDVMAPGNNMLSTSNIDPGDGYGYYEGALSGTSFATPIVTGVAALVWSLHPDWTNSQVADQIKMTCRDIGSTGWDQETGWGIVNAYRALTETPSVGKTVGQLSAITSGNQVTVGEAFVTSVRGELTDRLYVEQGDRACGIMLPFTTVPSGYSEGDTVRITGTLATVSGERAIQSATLTKLNTTTPPSPLKPIGMSTKAVGGTRIGYKSGITNGVGTNNVGLLVTVYGKVTAVGWTYFYIDDGASMRDGSGMRGLKIITRNLTKPAEGDYVRVTGIVSIEQPPDAGVSIPVVRVRRQSDWVKVH